MPHQTVLLRRVLKATCVAAALAALTLLTVPPSEPSHPPEQIHTTTAVINPTAIPASALPTTSTTTTTITEPSTTTTMHTAPIDEGTVGAAAIQAPVSEPPSSTWDGTVEGAVRAWFPDNFGSAWRVSDCESRHDPTVVSSGGGNWGLFQINTVHADAFETVTGRPFRDGALDAYANAQYARHLYDEQGWGPWSCRWAA